MYCVKKLGADLYWIGADDRRLAMFEGVYSVPQGVSYNSYFLDDEKTAVFDTADRAVEKTFFENLAHVLGGRAPDYLIVQHMEPDHSATLGALLEKYPGVTVVCTARTETMIGQFFGPTPNTRKMIVGDGDTLVTGRHTLRFLTAPMVHWPEVMVTFDETDKTLYSADAFGAFGALNGSIWADEVDFMRDHLDEARRYYANIVGKYGPQVQALLKKAAPLGVRRICPLHGWVWRRDIGEYIEKYRLWSSYTPEECGVMIAYASIYGNTANAAEIVAARLRDAGIKTAMYDVSVTPASEIIAAAFRWSHLVFASTTYNTGVFVTMDALLRDLAAHNIRGRTVAFIENGSWAPAAGKQMRAILENCAQMNFIEKTVTLRSALKDDQLPELEAFVRAIIDTVPDACPASV